MAKTTIDPILPSNYTKLTEKQMEREILEVAALLGYGYTHHETFSMGTKPGFPDWTLADTIDGGVVFLELKGARGKVSEAQREACEYLRRAGQHAYIVEPVDLPLVYGILGGRYLPPQPGTGHVDIHLVDLVVRHRPKWAEWEEG